MHGVDVRTSQNGGWEASLREKGRKGKEDNTLGKGALE